MSETSLNPLKAAHKTGGFFVIGVMVLIVTIVVSLCLGRYETSLGTVLAIVAGELGFPLNTGQWTVTQKSIVLLVRMPRILCSILAGAGLALSGGALQGVLKNPLVGPNILGVISGAAFGGSLAILLFPSYQSVVVLSSLVGVGAIILVRILGSIGKKTSLMLLILAGVVVNAFFNALITIVQYVADPDNKLPEIVYWLMGSMAGTNYADVSLLTCAVGIASVPVLLLSYRINVLAMGEEFARASGMNVELTQWVVFGSVAVISAATVAVGGIISWVGLVIPHFARMIVGPDHKKLLPASALLGGIYLLAMDNLARSASAAELPISIITALVGVPIFAILIRRVQSEGWKND